VACDHDEDKSTQTGLLVQIQGLRVILVSALEALQICLFVSGTRFESARAVCPKKVCAEPYQGPRVFSHGRALTDPNLRAVTVAGASPSAGRQRSACFSLVSCFCLLLIRKKHGFSSHHTSVLTPVLLVWKQVKIRLHTKKYFSIPK
jgi:hypothetical protein